jgi:hypothetical protein
MNFMLVGMASIDKMDTTATEEDERDQIRKAKTNGGRKTGR